MDDKTKREFIQLFNQGFEEVVLPQIEDLAEDVSILKENVDILREDVDSLKSEVHEINLKVGAYKDKTDSDIEKIKKRVGLV